MEAGGSTTCRQEPVGLSTPLAAVVVNPVVAVYVPHERARFPRRVPAAAVAPYRALKRLLVLRKPPNPRSE